MIITTANNETEFLIEKARGIALKHSLEYHPREGKSIQHMLNNVDPQIFVVNNLHGLSYYEPCREEAFYHPNMAFHRILNLKKGEPDCLANACRLRSGMSFFDGTVGLGADSLTAAFVVGDSGTVEGTEKSRPIYILTEEGLRFYALQNPKIAPAVSRIKIKNADNLAALRQCGDLSFDVIYFDFMFSRTVESSTGIQAIRDYGAYDLMTSDHLAEALRVAKQRIVVKSDRAGLELLGSLGFTSHKESARKNFCYAVLEK